MIKDNYCFQLVAGAKAGNRDSMSELAANVYQRLSPCLYRATLNDELSEDLLQEVLLTVIRFVGTLEQPKSFWSWLYRITRSKVQEHLRNEYGVEKRGLSQLCGTHHCGSSEDDNDILNLVIQREEAESLSAAIRHLKKQYRDVIQLRCFEEMSYLEISSVIGCSPQQARVRFFRAKQLLKRSPLVARFAED
ncbi:MAG TPA: sigma-70 family RNA polymerase sigma factor [Sedimentisphaerales bacterium]|nr:sigma-70 family RNA polymerase sigma factor [Sedimentisphaerales bacterium]